MNSRFIKYLSLQGRNSDRLRLAERTSHLGTHVKIAIVPVLDYPTIDPGLDLIDSTYTHGSGFAACSFADGTWPIPGCRANRNMLLSR